MRIDTGISCCAAEILAGNHSIVFSRLRITVRLAQPKVDHEHPITGLSMPHDEVIRLNVAMDDMPSVNDLKLADLQQCSQTRTSQMRIY